MKIGDLRHRVTFQEEVEQPDGYKGHTVTWSDVIEVWAAVEPLSGGEYFKAHQIEGKVTHRIRIRYNPSVTTKMRIEHRSRHFEIKSILDLKERREVMEILAEEIL